MRSLKTNWYPYALVALMLIAACARTGAPPGSVPEPDAAGMFSRGGWIQVEFEELPGKRYEGLFETGDPARRRISGELIAVESERIYVLTAGILQEFQVNDIEKAHVVAYDPQVGVVAAWMTLGVLSTISHGYYLVLSVPVWALVGFGTAHYAVDEAVVDYPKFSIEAFAAYARFPQGPPPNLDKIRL